MKLLNLIVCLFLLPAVTVFADRPGGKVTLNPALLIYVNKVKSEFASIPQERIKELNKIVLFIQNKVKSGEQVQLTYICTHNSRRSHFGQIWASIAAAYYDIPKVTTFSGGTESSTFNERAVAACRRAGFEIAKKSEGKNPVYEVKYAAGKAPLITFSKKYDDPVNPQNNFCAIMTCSQADKACPVVKGAASRVAVPYDDPKDFDGKPQEQAKYDERCKQIATETLYVFSKVKSKG